MLNEMKGAGVIGDYAIGGAVAAFLYIEPGTTFDLDVFVGWDPAANGLLTVSHIYDYLTRRGCTIDGPNVVIFDWPVQFLPPTNALVSEAIQHSKEITIEGVPTRIFAAEHLMAICLEVGRPKDLARLIQFIEEYPYDEARFSASIAQHGLSSKFAEFKAKFFLRS